MMDRVSGGTGPPGRISPLERIFVSYAPYDCGSDARTHTTELLLTPAPVLPPGPSRGTNHNICPFVICVHGATSGGVLLSFLQRPESPFGHSLIAYMRWRRHGGQKLRVAEEVTTVSLAAELSGSRISVPETSGLSRHTIVPYRCPSLLSRR
jgi:hypothetical protein